MQGSTVGAFLKLDTHSQHFSSWTHTHTAAHRDPSHPRCGCWDSSQTFKPLSKTRPLLIHRSPPSRPSWNGHCVFSLNKYIWKCSVTVYGNVRASRMFEPIPWKQPMFRADSLSPLIAGNGFQMCVARWSLSARAPSSCLIKPLQGVPDGGMIPGLGRRPRQLPKYSSGSLWNNNSHISSSWELHHHIFQIWKQLLSV